MEQAEIQYNPWNLAKLSRAQRMLEKGLSVKQVGSTLKLSPAQMEELETDALDVVPKPELETHAEWRRRKSEEIERKLIGVAERHLDSLSEATSLDSETMGTVRDASTIAHKWLRNGEDSVKTMTINFQALAQVKTPLPIKEGEFIELDQPED